MKTLFNKFIRNPWMYLAFALASATASYSQENLATLNEFDGQPKIERQDSVAIYQLYKNPESFYKKNNSGSIRIKNYRIYHLDASGIDLNEIPESVWNLEELAWLNLGDNNIRNISNEIENLKNLGWLATYNNKITSFPKGILNLPKLEWVGAWSNPLSKESKELLKELKQKGVKVWD